MKMPPEKKTLAINKKHAFFDVGKMLTILLLSRNF